MRFVTRGLVLRETVVRETGKLLTVLTADGGKHTVMARGARKKTGGLSAASQLLAYSEMTLFSYRDHCTLDEASTVEEFRPLRADVERLALGCYFAELTELLTDEDAATPAFLPLILNALYALSAHICPPGQVKAAFELRAMSLAGYEPSLEACAACGEDRPSAPFLNLREGMVFCGSCRPSGASAPLCAGSLAAMRHAVYGDPKRLYAFRLDAKALRRMGDACEAFVLDRMERRFHTLEFYKSLLSAPAEEQA